LYQDHTTFATPVSTEHMFESSVCRTYVRVARVGRRLLQQALQPLQPVSPYFESQGSG